MIDLRLRINDFGFGEKKNDSKLIYLLFKKNGQHKNIENHNSLI